MNFPANAFAEIQPYQLAAGSLFKFRESWALRVTYSDRKQDQSFITLQGRDAGLVRSVGQGMARSLFIKTPFEWFAVVDPQDPAPADALFTGSLTITQAGPIILCGDQDGDRYSFGVDGVQWHDETPDAARTRFDRWSAHLALTGRPFQSLGMICAVDRCR